MSDLPNRRKSKSNSSRVMTKQRAAMGAAIVFWHEAQGCPPTACAIPLNHLEPLTGNSVTEKTVCKAIYRDSIYNCIVIWIEEDKTPDELAQRLSTTAGERIYEDKGYRWAAELGLVRNDMPQDVGNWYGNERVNEQRSSSWDSLSEPREASPDLEEALNNHSPPTTQLVAAASPGSGSPDDVTMTVKPEQIDPLQEQVLDLSAQVVQMRHTIAALRQRQTEPRGQKKRHFDDDENDQHLQIASPSSHTAGNSVLPISPEDLLESMLLQSTWKKALKLGMKKMFTTEELITSVPTLRGARMSKNGKKPLDQERLSTVKNVLEKYCVQKNIWHPTKEVVHQELGGILFSIREANNPLPRLERLSSRKEAKMAYFSQQRQQNLISRKLFPSSQRTYSFKMPSFAAAMDLSDRKSPPSSFVSS